MEWGEGKSDYKDCFRSQKQIDRDIQYKLRYREAKRQELRSGYIASPSLVVNESVT
jgi:hypothetical protein